MPAKNTAVRVSRSKRMQSKQSQSKVQVKIQSSKTVFHGRVFSVASDRVKEPSGAIVRRDVVRHGGSVVILAVDGESSDPCVLLERQYRYAAGKYLWELPAGSLDLGEQPLAGAKRELLEETGYRARDWSRALFFYPSPGFVDETMTIYLARDLTPGPSHPEADEFITWKLTHLSQVLKAIRSGRIQDGKTIAGALWLAESLRGRKPLVSLLLRKGAC
jgi:ADP-ribose pyrophosphatase